MRMLFAGPFAGALAARARDAVHVRLTWRADVHARDGRPLNAEPQLAPATDVADQERRGRSPERAGAGTFALDSEATTGLALRHTRQIPDDPGFASAAQRLRDASAAMPGPRDMVATLEQLVAER